jgi:hypothetical protein
MRKIVRYKWAKASFHFSSVTVFSFCESAKCLYRSHSCRFFGIQLFQSFSLGNTGCLMTGQSSVTIAPQNLLRFVADITAGSVARLVSQVNLQFYCITPK